MLLRYYLKIFRPLSKASANRRRKCKSRTRSGRRGQGLFLTSCLACVSRCTRQDARHAALACELSALMAASGGSLEPTKFGDPFAKSAARISCKLFRRSHPLHAPAESLQQSALSMASRSLQDPCILTAEQKEIREKSYSSL